MGAEWLDLWMIGMQRGLLNLAQTEINKLRARTKELEEREASLRAVEAAARKFVNCSQPYPKEYDHLRFALMALSEHEDESP